MRNPSKRINGTALAVRVGRLLRKERLRLGLSQSEIATLRQATVSRIENGGGATVESLIELARALGLEIDFVPIGQAGIRFEHEAASGRSLNLLDLYSD